MPWQPPKRDTCTLCNKTVYFTEKITIQGQIYHEDCIRCRECNRKLSLGEYVSMEGVFYCKPHFQRLFRRTGTFSFQIPQHQSVTVEPLTERILRPEPVVDTVEIQSARPAPKVNEQRLSRRYSQALRQRIRKKETQITTKSPELGKSKIEIWQPIKYNGTQIISERSRHAAVINGDSMFVMGGDDGNTTLNDLYEFDFKSKAWTKVDAKGSIPKSRAQHSLAIFGKKLYLFGGDDGQDDVEYFNDVYQFDLEKKEWSEVKTKGPIPTPRTGHSAVLLEGEIFVFGGYNDDTKSVMNDLYALDIETLQWEKVKISKDGDEITAREAHCACGYEDYMIVFGGSSETGDLLNDLYSLAIDEKEWKKITGKGDIPLPRSGATIVSHGYSLYVFGGNIGSNALDNNLYSFDMRKQVWNQIIDSGSSAPSKREFHSAVVYKNGMIVFGGFNGKKEENDMYELEFKDVKL